MIGGAEDVDSQLKCDRDMEDIQSSAGSGDGISGGESICPGPGPGPIEWRGLEYAVIEIALQVSERLFQL